MITLDLTKSLEVRKAGDRPNYYFTFLRFYVFRVLREEKITR